MTGPTFLLKVDSKQLKRRLVMIEPAVAPSRREMTPNAAMVRIVFFWYLAVMDIGMTSGAFLSQIPEYPFFLLQMAGKTGCGQVSTIQRECRLCMVLHREQTALEAIHGMTVRTIANGPFPGKLAFMVIGMAGCAGVVGQGVRETLLVAIPAVYLLMFPQQGELRQAVIEIIQIIYPGKGFFAVAFGTGCSEFALVDILVALDTIRCQDAISVSEQVAG